ncbi:hypothetical protein TNIN_169991 [Trichonephila inaurata madagascariensis]|uniref:Uncharacterized protein n=1 Tax=Trichonephila inaurata madagascariensis TaxID=2747483 RepID=A0A8X7BYG4_9ARAC|nr:hypothetical protein TNIN_169991 [Trichonephila inaurata madagascariensis]
MVKCHGHTTVKEESQRKNIPLKAQFHSFWFFCSEFFFSISKKMTSKKARLNGEAVYLIQDQSDEIYKNYSTIIKAAEHTAQN